MTGELDGAGVADGQAADGLPAEGQPAASIDGSFVAVAKPSVASVELDGEGVLYDEEAGASHLLNATATVVWSCLDGSGTLDEIAAELADAFGADAQTVRHDVIALVQQFGRQGLLVGIAAEPPAEAGTGAGADGESPVEPGEKPAGDAAGEPDGEGSRA